MKNMHSRIFEISESSFIDKDDHYFFDFEDLGSMPSGVDYVVETENREDDIEWLRDIMSHYKGITFDDESFIVSTDFKNEYFEKRFKDLKERVEELTLEEFSDENKGMMELYYIKKAIEDRLGFRVFNYNYGNMSFDTFVRHMKPNVRYYIGGIGDYHY